MDDPFDALSPREKRSRPVGAASELIGDLRARLRPRGDPLEDPGQQRSGPIAMGLVAIGAVALLGLGAWWMSQGRAQPVDLPRAAVKSAAAPSVPTPAGQAVPAEQAVPAGQAVPAVTTMPTGSSVPQEVVVHVAGQVLHPGLYTVNVGGRLADAIAAAGGATPQADLDRVNLAEPLADGSRAYIPALGQVEAPGTMPQEALGPGVGSTPGSVSGSVPKSPGTNGAGTSDSATPGALINLNTADQAALEELPGVGPVTAEAIVAHRSEAGPFTQVEDLLEVRGIGDAKLEGLADLVTV